MTAPAANKSSPEANTKNARNCMDRLSGICLPLVEILHPLGEMAFSHTPLAANLERGQFLALEHPVHRSPGQSQQFSSLLESQQRKRLRLIFGRRFHCAQIEQRQGHGGSKRSRPFVGKSGSPVEDVKGHL